MSVDQGRLAGKVALIAGIEGSLGEQMARRYLAEGATVVLAGLAADQVSGMRQQLVATGAAPERVAALRLDSGDAGQVRAAVKEIVGGGPAVSAPFGRIDTLVINVASAGAPRRLADIPLTAGESQGSKSETLDQSLGALVGATWNLVRAVAPVMPAGSNIISISAAFPAGDDYGRIPYIVPKAALTALNHALAAELTGRGIRLQTIAVGATDDESPAASSTPHDVAAMAAFLSGDESRALGSQALLINSNADLPAENRTTFVSRPGLRTVDAAGKVVLISAGDQVEDALALADGLRSGRATIAIGFRDATALARAEHLLREPDHQTPGDTYGRPADSGLPLLVHLDPLDPASTAAAFSKVQQALGGVHDAVVLPAYAHDGASTLLEADDATVTRFLKDSLAGTVAMAVHLARFWRDHPPAIAPHALFLSNPDDGHGNRSAKILGAAVEQLVRIWRHESIYDAQVADTGATSPSADAQPSAPSVWSNQIMRFTNTEAAGRDFAAAWVVRLIGSAKRIEEINLYLPAQLEGSIGRHTQGFGWAESLFGLHMDKVALITGGSAGIGGQIGRLLAMSGARVMLAARNATQLDEFKAGIVRELREAGYPNPDQRVQTLPGCDVGDRASITKMVEQTLATFGRVDYLINNAGLAGAEEMVIDLPLDAWRHTLEANMVSNYRLLRRLAPQMTQRGYVLNVSSYFGGEKYVAIPYPNRSDYAVSKAGQRAMVESLARFLGPKIQINALAPGPVEGERLKGTGSRPGLFQRRAKLILENKRTNDIMAALFEAQHATGAPISDLLPALMRNDVQELARGGAEAPAAIQKLATAILAQSDPAANSRTFLMNERIARRLVRRLETGGYMTGWQAPGGGNQLPNAPEPFFTPAQIDREAGKVRSGILSMLNLGKMPTEFDVALATVYYLADRNVTGETFHPSGGLNFDRTVTEGELFGKASPQRLEKLKDTTIFLIGEHMQRHIVRLAQVYLEEYHAARVAVITESEQGAQWYRDALPEYSAAGRVGAIAAGTDIESAIDRASREFGRPAAVINTPFRPLPTKPLAGNGSWDDVLDEDEFADVVERNITHHFRVAQKVSLIDGATLVLVTPETTARSTNEEFALANFIKTTLHALTATLGAESERVMPHVPVNQVDLTRRARAEEPRNEAEEEEELARFVQAVLLVSAPLPSPQESRYRARIYRGNAITV